MQLLHSNFVELQEDSVLILLIIMAPIMEPIKYVLLQALAQFLPIKKLQYGQMQATIACLALQQVSLSVRVAVHHTGTIMIIMHR